MRPRCQPQPWTPLTVYRRN